MPTRQIVYVVIGPTKSTEFFMKTKTTKCEVINKQ